MSYDRFELTVHKILNFCDCRTQTQRTANDFGTIKKQLYSEK